MKFVFLICTERSGSNLITSIANAHSEISGPPPSHLFRLFGLNSENYFPLDKDENWHVFLDDFLDARNAMLGEWNTSFNREQLTDACVNREMRSAFELMYGLEAENDNASTLFVKENHTYSFADFLIQNWPNCHFVHLVRDPRDVASSWLKTYTIPGGIKKAIDVWSKDQAETLNLFSEEVNAEKLLMLRYEDLLSNPVSVLKTLCDHISLPFDAGMLNHTSNIRTLKNASRIEAWENLAKPIISTNTGKYKDTLTQNEVRYIELRCFELMNAFGYVPDTVQSPLTPDVISHELKQLELSVRDGEVKESFSDNELAIRQKRQAIIKRVLFRGKATA